MQRLKWLLPGMRVKRYFTLILMGSSGIGLGTVILLSSDRLRPLRSALAELLSRLATPAQAAIGGGVIAASIVLLLWGIRSLIHSLTERLLPGDQHSLAARIYRSRNLDRGPRIVALGGGTGLATMLRGLKEYSGHITAIVTVADDGGSSGRIRDDLGILPPGDIRNTLISLAHTEPLMERLFQYRFSWGDGLAGHSFGNLFIAAMTDITGDFEVAVQEMSKVLAVTGRVLPATLDTVKLKAFYHDGGEVVGESRIPQVGREIERVSLSPPQAAALPEALEAIAAADVILLGPGSLYTSVIPNLLVPGIAEALEASPAVKIYVCNVMTQPGETDGMSAADHVQAVLDHAAGRKIVDYCLLNAADLTAEQAAKYGQEGAVPIAPDLEQLRRLGLKVRTGRLLDSQVLVRHDPQRLAAAIMELIDEELPGLRLRRHG